MKKRDFMAEIKEKPLSDLREQARKTAEELMKLRFRKAAGQLEQTHQIGQLRKNLARLETVINRKQSGEAVTEA